MRSLVPDSAGYALESCRAHVKLDKVGALETVAPAFSVRDGIISVIQG